MQVLQNYCIFAHIYPMTTDKEIIAAFRSSNQGVIRQSYCDMKEKFFLYIRRTCSVIDESSIDSISPHSVKIVGTFTIFPDTCLFLHKPMVWHKKQKINTSQQQPNQCFVDCLYSLSYVPPNSDHQNKLYMNGAIAESAKIMNNPIISRKSINGANHHFRWVYIYAISSFRKSIISLLLHSYSLPAHQYHKT